eukprot:jgi/Mesen1/8450/ME000475S07704
MGLISVLLIAAEAHPANAAVAAATSHTASPSGPQTGSQSTMLASEPQRKGKMDDLKKGLIDLSHQAKTVTNNVWGHLSTGQSPMQTAVGKLQNYKLLTPGSAQKHWRENFLAPANDTLKDYYACHLSTSTGPVPGTLFVATHSISFLSDRPLSYTTSPGQVAWSMYKVVLPVEKVASLNVPTNPQRPLEKYIQISMVDKHEFWFMGFISFDKALSLLQSTCNRTSNTVPGSTQGAQSGQTRGAFNPSPAGFGSGSTQGIRSGQTPGAYNQSSVGSGQGQYYQDAPQPPSGAYGQYHNPPNAQSSQQQNMGMYPQAN